MLQPGIDEALDQCGLEVKPLGISEKELRILFLQYSVLGRTKFGNDNMPSNPSAQKT